MRGPGLAPGKWEKATKFLFCVSPMYVKIKCEIYEAPLGFLLFTKDLPGYLAQYSPGERSLHLQGDLSDRTNTHRCLVSCINIRFRGILEVEISRVYHSCYISQA